MARTLAWMLIVLFVAGCGSAPYSAPVKEAGRSARTKARDIRPESVQVQSGFYRVQPGDTLYKVAFENGLDYQALATWNNLADPSLIRVGELLRLSPPAGHGSIEPRADKQATKARATGNVEDPETPPERWVWPARGEVVTQFDEAQGKKGIDIANRRGTPVLAAAAGRVVYAGSGLRGYGKLIIIKHSRSMLSAYGHQDEIFVREGQAVKQGQPIGRMGDTDADRVKLHFEIREYGRPVDPGNYLPTIVG